MLVPLRHVAGTVEHEDDDADGERAGYLQVLRRPGMASLVVISFVASFVGYAQLNAGMPAYARAVGEVSTRGLGVAFAGSTVVIVVLQLVVLRWIEGRRRTRVIALMATIWAASWMLLGATGLVSGTWGATMLVAACASVFALGETLLQPTVPALVNDLATDRLRGRYNAASTAAFQAAQVSAPPIAGFLIGHQLNAAYIGSLVLGCCALGVLAVVRLEPQLSPLVNGAHEPPRSGPRLDGAAAQPASCAGPEVEWESVR